LPTGRLCDALGDPAEGIAHIPATAYLDAIRKSGKKYKMKTVGQLSSTEFMAACKDDVFKISFYCV
jgi:hypothetical protein